MPTVTKYVAADADNGRWALSDFYPATDFRTTSTLTAGYLTDSSSNHVIWGAFFRIAALGVAQGSVINSAFLHVPINQVEQSGAVLEVALYDSDNPSAPTTYAQAKNPTLTSSQETYQNDDFATTAIYEFTGALQEVANRGGFDASSAIVVDVRSEYDQLSEPPSRLSGVGNFLVSFQSLDTGGPAWVEIDYTPPNTAPTITSGPTVDYAGSNTRLGPNATPATVTFTATDAEDTGANELTWEIRTAANGGGTLVATGTCTSGVSEVANVAYDDSGVSEGQNDFFVRVGDGTDWSTDSPITVDADFTPPSITNFSVTEL